MTNAPDVPVVILAVDDLFFSSRIKSTARLMGVKVLHATDVRQLHDLLAGLVPRMIILDLNSQACAPLDAVRRIKADTRLSQVPIIGFLSHVQRDLQRKAREEGCDQVLPRSTFSANLSRILESARKSENGVRS
jgi:CheY-like chemotaxis protein